MLTLGIDTAGRWAGVALLRDHQVLATRGTAGPQSAVLLPLIEDICSSQGVRPRDIQLLGVAQGPGTYTGLRVGIVTAKMLGRASGATVLGVPTLEAMAAEAPPTTPRVLVALRAYKRRVLTAWFDRLPGGPLALTGEPVLCTVDQVPEVRATESVITDEPELLTRFAQTAATVTAFTHGALAVARLALARQAAGASDEMIRLTPSYLRPPSVTLKPGQVPGVVVAS